MATPALLAALWAGLNGLDAKSWIVGVPIVILATIISWRLAPERGSALRWGALPAFVGYFLRESFRGGGDVARRALRPGPCVDPGVVTYAMRLPHGPARAMFAGAIGLLPGTLVIAITDKALEVHALDASADVLGALRELERRVAGLFGIPLGPTGESMPAGSAPDASISSDWTPGTGTLQGEAPSGGPA
jgi:multicomponent Na+:H+ antiporter subunit E